MSPSKERDTKQQILVAALEAFASSGYDKTSMDDIVRASGLSKGTLYWHFKNKQALFAGLLTMITDQFMEPFAEMARQAEEVSPLDALRLIFQGTAEMIQEDARFAALSVDFFLQAWHDEAVQEIFATFYLKYINQVADIIQRGIDSGHFKAVDPHAAASAIVAAIDGITIQQLLEKEIHHVDEKHWEIRAVFEAAEQLMIDGLRKGNAGDR